MLLQVLRNLLDRNADSGAASSDAQNLDGERSQNIKVDKSATSKLRQSNVEEENSLENPVEWNPVENGIAPELQYAESSKDNPVSKEMGVVSGALGFKGFE